MTDHAVSASWSRHDSAGLGGILAIVAATALLGVGPPIVDSMTREQLQRRVDQSLAQADQTAADAQRVLGEKSAIDRRLDESRVTLLPLGQLNQRVMSIVDLGTGCGLNVAQVTPGQQTSVRQSQVVRLTVTASGGYGQISDFLSRLHAQFLDIVVAGFSAEARRSDRQVAGAVVFELDWYAAPAGSEAVKTP